MTNTRSAFQRSFEYARREKNYGRSAADVMEQRDDALAKADRYETALRRVAEYDGEWVEDDPLVIRDYARHVLRGAVD